MNNRVGIDFDGTIIPFGPLVDMDQPPFKRVPEALRLVKEAGYEIIILTSRLSPYWWNLDYERFGAESPEAFGKAQIQYMHEYLKKWNIPYDLITCEKIPCRIYFDDMFITINEENPLSVAIAKFLL